MMLNFYVFIGHVALGRLAGILISRSKAVYLAKTERSS